MTESQAARIRRLNILLSLGKVDIAALNGTEWEKLLDDIYFAVLGSRRSRAGSPTTFDAAVGHVWTREGLRAAQEGLRGRLPLLIRPKPKANLPRFDLAKQYLFVGADEKGFYHRRVSEDGPTMIYETLAYLLERSEITPADLLICANEKCQRVFVPLRKPHKGKKSYHSPKCSNLVAAREHRKRKTEESNAQEKERSHRRYVDKVHEKHRKALVKRRPQKKPRIKAPPEHPWTKDENSPEMRMHIAQAVKYGLRKADPEAKATKPKT